jgi:V/A-type H+-transporting ATPase subunit F
MYKMGVVGDKDSITIYKAAGLDIFPVKDVQESRSLINRLVEEQYGVLFIIENLANNLNDVFERYKESVIPILISLPGVKGSEGTGMKELKKAMERAIGVDVLFREN